MFILLIIIASLLLLIAYSIHTQQLKKRNWRVIYGDPETGVEKPSVWMARERAESYFNIFDDATKIVTRKEKTFRSRA